MYFVDDTHQSNYERMKKRWPRCKESTEYQSACYIVATPLVFEKVGADIEKWDTPVAWMYKHLEGEISLDLTSGTRCMTYLMLNLWNGSHQVDVLDAIGYLDRYNYRVFKCALDIRRGLHREQ